MIWEEWTNRVIQQYLNLRRTRNIYPTNVTLSTASLKGVKTNYEPVSVHTFMPFILFTDRTILKLGSQTYDLIVLPLWSNGLSLLSNINYCHTISFQVCPTYDNYNIRVNRMQIKTGIQLGQRKSWHVLSRQCLRRWHYLLRVFQSDVLFWEVVDALKACPSMNIRDL